MRLWRRHSTSAKHLCLSVSSRAGESGASPAVGHHGGTALLCGITIAGATPEAVRHKGSYLKQQRSVRLHNIYFPEASHNQCDANTLPAAANEVVRFARCPRSRPRVGLHMVGRVASGPGCVCANAPCDARRSLTCVATRWGMGWAGSITPWGATLWWSWCGRSPHPRRVQHPHRKNIHPNEHPHRDGLQ